MTTSLEVDLPAAFFLDVPDGSGGWVVHGRYERDWFSRQADGSYVGAGVGGSPLFLRVVAREDAILTALDGQGETAVYRMRPAADGG